MNTGLTVTSRVHFTRATKGRVGLKLGPAPLPVAPPAPGRVLKLARLMALAIRFEHLLSSGQVKDAAELARVGHVTRARVTQVMNLLCLAPDLQEQLLFLPPVEAGRDPVKEWEIRPVAAEPSWSKQRRMWQRLVGHSSPV